MISRIRSFVNIPIVFAVLFYTFGAITGALTYPKHISTDKFMECGSSPKVALLGIIQMYQSMGATKAMLMEPVDREIAKSGSTDELKSIKETLDYAFDKTYKYGPVIEASVECVNK